MNEFITWDFLLTFAGCVMVTAILTEVIKRIFENLSSKVYQIVSYLIALLILITAQFATHQLTGWDVAALDMLNAAIVSLTSNGGYDLIHNALKPVTDLETEYIDEGDEE